MHEAINFTFIFYREQMERERVRVSFSAPTREQMEAGVPGAELRDGQWAESRDRKWSAEVTVM